VTTPPPLSLYLHLPWCVSKCPYCDFNSHRAGDKAPYGRYVKALQADIVTEAGKAGHRCVESIFLGGGTPSLFSPAQLGAILDTCRDKLVLAQDCEITMEANPGTVEHGKLAAYRHAGVTRLSIGAQSFDPALLIALGRVHGPEEIIAAFEEAQEADFDSINIDLMFALPGQDLEGSRADVARLVALGPSHVSYYQLTLEPNTGFYRQPPQDLPDDELAWRIQEQGHRLLGSAGYERYEISAFAKAGYRCRHNLNYWQFGDYLAAGAGAHGKLTDSGGRVSRYRKPANPLQFMERAERGELDAAPVTIEAADLAFEFMLNVLRLADGVPGELFLERTGLDPGLIEVPIRQAVADGLLQPLFDGRWRPTADGYRFLNDLQARFLP